MKIQLIHPPSLLNLDSLTALRPSLPLGLAYVAATLERDGHDVSVVDAVSEAPEQVVKEGRLFRIGLSKEEIAARIDDDTKVVGIGNMWSFAWPVVRPMIHEIRSQRPDVTIVCGGEHFTGLPEFSMEETPIDFVVLGEGEEIASELMKALDEGRTDFENIDGIAYRENGEIVCNKRRDRTREIDAIPWPAWHLFDVLKYDENKLIFGIHFGRTIPILATRGCPYQCSYCSSPQMWTTRWYARDPEDVANEIQTYVEDFGATNFPFQDLTAIIKRDWIVRFAKELIRRKLEITWQLPSGTRCEVVDDEVSELLYRSGCRSLNFAPESGSDEIRKEIKKRMKTEPFLEAVKAATRYRLNLACFIVLGFPKDTKKGLQASVKLARKLAWMGVDDVCCAFFFPLPSTELYDYLIETGRITLDDAFLMTPLHTHDKYLTGDRNYCEAVSARALSYYRYKVLINFYMVSFVTHPTRVFWLLWNAIRGKETTKLDGFVQETKRKVLLSLKNLILFRRRQRRRPSAVPAGGH